MVFDGIKLLWFLIVIICRQSSFSSGAGSAGPPYFLKLKGGWGRFQQCESAK